MISRSRWKCIVAFGLAGGAGGEARAARRRRGRCAPPRSAPTCAARRGRARRRGWRCRRSRPPSCRNALSLAHATTSSISRVSHSAMRDLGLVDDLAQLAGAQHRHRVDHDGARLGGGQPARHHRRVVGRADQHPVAGLHAVVLGERVRQPVGPVGQLLVGAPAAVADERGVVAEALLDHAVGQLDGGVEVLGVVEAGRAATPATGRAAAGCRGRTCRRGRSGRASCSRHGSTAVASISTLARPPSAPPPAPSPSPGSARR